MPTTSNSTSLEVYEFAFYGHYRFISWSVRRRSTTGDQEDSNHGWGMIDERVMCLDTLPASLNAQASKSVPVTPVMTCPGKREENQAKECVNLLRKLQVKCIGRYRILLQQPRSRSGHPAYIIAKPRMFLVSLSDR